MLGKLVNKFKRQTLQDGAASPPGQLSPPPSGANRDGPTRRSARLNGRAEQRTMPTVEKGGANGQSPSPPNTRARRAQQQQMEEIIGNRKPPSVQPKSSSQGPPGCDSGTESDDDELEMLDSLSNASRAALEDGIIGRSPPTLTSSPPLISEFETSSWDSCGCESGIVLRDSAERDDASRNVDLLEAAFGGGHQLVMEIGNRRKAGGGDMDTAGTTPVQSKDAFPAHFRSGTARPLPIDFSALRHSELLFSAAGSPPMEDAPTPIGSHKGPGQGAILMEMAQLENNRASAEQQQQQHQGAFRRVLRRTRRNSNSQPVPADRKSVV